MQALRGVAAGRDADRTGRARCRPGVCRKCEPLRDSQPVTGLAVWTLTPAARAILR